MGASPDLCYKDLVDLLPGQAELDVRTADLCRWKIGGAADVVITPHDRTGLAVALRYINAHGIRHVVIGDGSNLLFDDDGFRGALIRISRTFCGYEMLGYGLVRVEAGAWVPSLVRRLISDGLSGAVHAIGIPGTLGGLVVMNGGSQRHGIGELVERVEVMDRDGEISWLNPDDLDFAYRKSALQNRDVTVLSCELRLEPGDTGALRREAIAILADRRAKFPKVRQNCGSVFVSDPKLYSLIGPPGLAIERAGLKGLALGDAQISPSHANFIVNNGHARSADVLSLIATARDRVEAMTGIAMVAEVRYLSPLGELRPAHDARTAIEAIGV